jgi:hypothetical protein
MTEVLVVFPSFLESTGLVTSNRPQQLPSKSVSNIREYIVAERAIPNSLHVE